LRARLRSAGTAFSQIRGVLITHEHADHILGLPALMKNYAIPAIADSRTLAAIQEIIVAGILRMESGPLVSLLEEELDTPGTSVKINGTGGDWENIQAQHSTPLAVGSRCMIGDIEVVSFPVSHDAVAPSGYLLSAGVVVYVWLSTAER